MSGELQLRISTVGDVDTPIRGCSLNANFVVTYDAPKPRDVKPDRSVT
jgi:hypothetical protein